MKLLKILTICLLSIMLFGCSYSEANINIDSKGNYTISGYITFSKENLEQVDMNIDEVLEMIALTGYDLRNGDLEYINEIHGGTQYIGYSFNNVKGLPITVELDDKFIPDIHFKSEGISKDVLNTNLFADQLSDFEYLTKIGVEVSINLIFPGEIKHNNVGEVSHFNQLNLNMVDLIEGVEIVASSSFLSLYMWALVTTITLIIILYIYKKRINQKRRIKNIIKYSDHQLLALQKTNLEMAEAFNNSKKSKYSRNKILRNAIKKKKSD